MGLVHIAHCRDDSFQHLSPAAKAELVRTFLDVTGAPPVVPSLGRNPVDRGERR